MSAPRRMIAALALLTSALGQTSRPAPKQPETFRISGTVVHALSGDPLPQTELAILSVKQYKVVQRAFCDDQGRFEFTGVAPGKYSLEARRPGFFRQGLNQHEYFWTGIAVGPGFRSDGIVFRLRPDASISGTVTDNQTEGVADAQVLLFTTALRDGRRSTSLARQVTSDDTGHYHFPHLPPGSYYVAVQAQPWYAQAMANVTPPDEAPPESTQVAKRFARPNPSRTDLVYPVTFYPGVTDSSASTPIGLKPGEQAEADMMLTPVPAIHVRIRQPGSVNDPPANLSFSRRFFGSYTSYVPLLSSGFREGVMEVSGLAPGEYKLAVQTFGDNPKTWTQDVSLYSDTEISATGARSPVKINGVVVQGGVPVTSQPWIVLSDGGGSARTRASEDGKFEITEYLDPGTYEVSVYNVHDSLVSRLTAAGAKIEGRSIEIAGPGTVSLVVEMSQGIGTINGTALQDDKPTAGAMVLLVPTNEEHSRSLVRRDQSDSDGTFTLRNVAPGTYTLLALNDWDIEWANPAVLQPYLEHGQRIEVAGGKTLQVKVKAQ
jgi:Carboxypeptidase regulatory-like domain